MNEPIKKKWWKGSWGWSKKQIIAFVFILVILISIVSFGAGVQFGAMQIINLGLKISHRFVNITFNDAQIANAIYQYQNNIGVCYG